MPSARSAPIVAKAGKAAGDGIPVVFMAVGDPVGAGVVASLARPGGNVTGLSDLAAGLQGIRLQLLREIVPAASLFAVVLNPGTPYAALAYKELEGAAHGAKVELRAFEVRSPEEIAPQLEASKAAGASGLVIFDDPLTLSRRNEIAAVAARLRLPAIHGYREFAVEQPAKCELVVNLKTAKASNFTVPQTIMIRASSDQCGFEVTRRVHRARCRACEQKRIR
jgi:putative ABC transport system substrate-binding protein